ncbi:MAG: FAD-binding oxidoreductase, partial [Proteobacteria bacterium]|nr:FAD-binding oxidoreductase [Pseudomonadota bacterium]
MLKSILILALGSIASLNAFSTEVVNDVTQLNPIVVDRVFKPASIEEIQKFVAAHPGVISIGGGRYSMGGQTAIENSVQIDMRSMNKVVNLDVKNKKITVQAGIRWRDIQEVIDPANLSIKIMQTYSNFTVGGSLSVNVHGRYIGQGPLIRSVDSIRLVLADGSLVTASPKEHPELFYGAIGGYGGIGVIVEATLQLADNEKVERVQKVVATKDYTAFFKKEIRDDPKVVFHNGDIYPPEFEKVSAVSWVKTDKPLTVEERLIPRNQKYTFQPRAIQMLNNMP